MRSSYRWDLYLLHLAAILDKYWLQFSRLLSILLFLDSRKILGTQNFTNAGYRFDRNKRPQYWYLLRVCIFWGRRLDKVKMITVGSPKDKSWAGWAIGLNKYSLRQRHRTFDITWAANAKCVALINGHLKDNFIHLTKIFVFSSLKI